MKKNNLDKTDFIMLSLLIAVILFIFRAPLLTGEPFRPGSDCYYLDFPMRALAWDSIRSHEAPYWNPYNSAGINLLGSNPFFYLIYPFYDVAYLFAKAKMFFILSLVQIMQLILAFTGMYLLLKKIFSDSYISLWGTILYGFSYPAMSAFFISTILLANYAYLPWLFLFYYGILERNTYLNITVLSVLMFLMLGGGELQWNLFIFLILFLFIVFNYNPFKKDTAGKFWKIAFITLASSIIAFLLGATEFLPFLEQNANGARGNVNLATANTQQNWMPPWFLSLRLFMPDLFDKNLQNFVHNPMIFLADNFNSFFGAVPALLSLYAVFLRKRLTSWKAVFVIVLGVAFGFPFLTALLRYVFLKSDLVYTRIGSLLPFMGAILACAALVTVINDRKKTTAIIDLLSFAIAALVFMLIFFKFFGKPVFGEDLDLGFIRVQIFKTLCSILAYMIIFYLWRWKDFGKKPLLILLAMLTFAEMMIFSVNKIKLFLSVRPASEYFGNTEGEKALDGLLADEKQYYRVHNASVRFEDLARNGIGGPYMHYFPNANIFNKFYEVNGYILNMQRDVGQILTNMKGVYFVRMADLLLYNSLPNLLSIKYIVAPAGFDPYTVEPDGFRLSRLKKYRVIKDFSDGRGNQTTGLRIIEIEDIPPRFYFTKTVKAGLDRDTIFNNVTNAAFDPREITYFEEPLQEENFDTKKQKIMAIETPTPNRVILDTNTETAGILVANNFWHKWWKVKINGKQEKVYRVNYNFQAIKIPAGKSRIVFYCQAESFRWGLRLSLLGLIALFTLLILYFKQKDITVKINRVKVK